MTIYTLANDIILSAVMGFCTYLILPLVLNRKFVASKSFIVFNAIAIGILIFLLLDIYADVGEVLFPQLSDGSTSFIADPGIAAVFVISVIVSFLIVYWAEGEEGEEAELTGDRTALAVSVGIGFQNLTEGLVFGAYWVLGAQNVAVLILVGYSIQNMTEGFPIVAAYIGKKDPGYGKMAWLFFVRGIPTVAGGIVGWYAVDFFIVNGSPTYDGNIVTTAINGIAIGSILYCILPILLAAFKPESTEAARSLKIRLIFLGILAGFVIGFAVGCF
jgi:ZIP family zinc transporter